MTLILEYQGNQQVIDLPDDPSDHQYFEKQVIQLFGIKHFTADFDCLSDGQIVLVQDLECCCKHRSQASFVGHLNCLIVLTNRYNFCEDSFEMAVSQGFLKIVQYLHENYNAKECSCSGIVVECAAKNGRLECLEYLIDNDYPCNEYAINFAAESGHLDCIKYLCSKGIKPTHHALKYATTNRHFDCVKYLVDIGCSSSYALHSSRLINECTEYIRRRGKP